MIVLAETATAKARDRRRQQEARTAQLQRLWANQQLWKGPKLSEIVIAARATEDQDSGSTQ